MKKIKKKTLAVGRGLKRSWSNSSSVSQLISIAAYKKHNNELVRKNRKLAVTLQETLLKNYCLNRQMKDYSKNTQQVMYARLKLKEMAISITKLVTDITEVTQCLDGSFAISSNMFENSPSDYKLKVRAPNVSCIEEVSVLSRESAEGTIEDHPGAPLTPSEESSDRKYSKDNTITPEIQPSPTDANLNISADVPPLLFIGDPGEKIKDKSTSKGKSSRKSHMIEAGSLTPKLDLDLNLFNLQRTSSRRQTKNFSLQNKRTNSKKRSTLEKCVSPEEQVTSVKKNSGNSLSANKKDQFCDTGKVISSNNSDVNNEASHISPPAAVANIPAKLPKDVLPDCTMLLGDDMELTEVLPVAVQLSAKSTVNEAPASRVCREEKSDNCENVEHQENEPAMDCSKETANISENSDNANKDALKSPDVFKEAVENANLHSFSSFSPAEPRRARKNVSYAFFSSDDSGDDSDFQISSLGGEGSSKSTRDVKPKFFQKGVTTNRLSIKKISNDDESKAVMDLSIFDLDVSDSKMKKKPRKPKTSKIKKDDIKNFFKKPSQKYACTVSTSGSRSNSKAGENYMEKPNDHQKESVRKSILDGKKCTVEGENKRFSSILRQPDTPRANSKRVSFSATDQVLMLSSNNMSENKRMRRTSKSAAEIEEISCPDACTDYEKATPVKAIHRFNKETVFTFDFIGNTKNCPSATNVLQENLPSSSRAVCPAVSEQAQRYNYDNDNETYDKVQTPREPLPDSNNEKTSSSKCVSESGNKPNQDVALDLNKFIENEITFNFSEPTELYTFPLKANDNLPSLQSAVPANTEDTKNAQCSKLQGSQQKLLKNVDKRTLEKNPLLKETSKTDVKEQTDKSEMSNFPEKNKQPMLPKSKIVPQQEIKQNVEKGTSNCLAKTLVKSDKKESVKADRKKKIESSETSNFPEKNKQLPLPKSKIVAQQESMQDSAKGASDCLAKTLVKSDKKEAVKADRKKKIESSETSNFPEKNEQSVLPKCKLVAQQELMQESAKGASDCLAETLVKSDKKEAVKADRKKKTESSETLNFPEKNKQSVLPKCKIVAQQELMQDSDKRPSDCLAKTSEKSDKKEASKTDDKQQVESSDTLKFPEKNKQPILPKSKIVAQLMQDSDKVTSDCLAKTSVKSDKKTASKMDDKQKDESSDTEKKIEISESLPEQLRLPSSTCSKASAVSEQPRNKSKSKKDDLNSENNQITKEQMPHSVANETKCIDGSKAKLFSGADCEADFLSDIVTEDVPDQTEQHLNARAHINKSGKQVKDGTAVKRTRSSRQDMPLVSERESDEFEIIKPVARKKTKLLTDNIKENIASSDHPALDVSLDILEVEVKSNQLKSSTSRETQSKRKNLSRAGSGNIILKKVRKSIVPKSVESSPVLKDLANMEGIETNTRARRSKVMSYKEGPLNRKMRRP